MLSDVHRRARPDRDARACLSRRRRQLCAPFLTPPRGAAHTAHGRGRGRAPQSVEVAVDERHKGRAGRERFQRERHLRHRLLIKVMHVDHVATLVAQTAVHSA